MATKHLVYHTGGFGVFDSYSEAQSYYEALDEDLFDASYGILSLSPLVVHWSNERGGLNFRQIRDAVLTVTSHFLGGVYKGTPAEQVALSLYSSTYTVYVLPVEEAIVMDRIERLGYTVTLG